MNILSAENISKSYGIDKLLNNISLGISEGEKLGLIGVNGTGKSTFLKILSGVEQPDEGNIIIPKNVKIRYLPQNPIFQKGATVLEQISKGDCPENEAKSILTRLGIDKFDAKIENLSGGERKRVALAGALISKCDLLILDEPTNHMDNQTVKWLEEYLNKRKGALIMVTHDRYFLDRVVNRIIEIDKGNLYSYRGNYSSFIEKKLEREQLEAASEQKRQSLFKNELKWIKRGAKARSTKQKARIDRFEKLSEEKYDNSEEKIHISAASSRLGKKVVELKGICKSICDKKLIEGFSIIVSKEDRIGIIGNNGCGKSTLMNILVGNLQPDSGIVEMGTTVKIGYFSQENTHMDENQRVIEYIKEVAEFISLEDGSYISASQMLEKFLFNPDMQWTPISKLSGGEKRRLYLLRVLMGAPNVLLLDEPTNDLDIQTLTILEDYLESFGGAVLAVSHDRYFLDKVSKKILSFGQDGNIEHYVGNYSDYEDFCEKYNENKNEKIRNKKVQNKNRDKNTKKPLKFSYKETREFEEIDGIIEEIETELSEIKEKIQESSSNYEKLQKLLAKETELSEKLDEKMDRWAYLNELAERIEIQKQGGE